MTLEWRHNGHDSVSNHQPHHCLLNRLFRRRSKKTSKLHVTGLCAGNSPGTGEFPAQMASNAEKVSIWWRHHDIIIIMGPTVGILSGGIYAQLTFSAEWPLMGLHHIGYKCYSGQYIIRCHIWPEKRMNWLIWFITASENMALDILMILLCLFIYLFIHFLFQFRWS